MLMPTLVDLSRHRALIVLVLATARAVTLMLFSIERSTRLQSVYKFLMNMRSIWQHRVSQWKLLAKSRDFALLHGGPRELN